MVTEIFQQNLAQALMQQMNTVRYEKNYTMVNWRRN